jgi:hypothetical protein
MKMIGTISAEKESMISDAPGLIIMVNWRTSLLARAIRSPTRWLLWKVWLLPSSDWYSSSRLSRSTRCAVSSESSEALRSSTLRVATMTTSAMVIESSASRSGCSWSRRSKARPISHWTMLLSPLWLTMATNAAIAKSLCRPTCEAIHRTGLDRSYRYDPATLNSEFKGKRLRRMPTLNRAGGSSYHRKR